jgi:hypothetical protein
MYHREYPLAKSRAKAAKDKALLTSSHTQSHLKEVTGTIVPP